MKNKIKLYVFLVIICCVVAILSDEVKSENSYQNVFDNIACSNSMRFLGQALYVYFTGVNEINAQKYIADTRTTGAFDHMGWYFIDVETGEEEGAALVLTDWADFSMMVEDTIYEWIPIAREALVFINSMDNPIQNITLTQLRDIYSGYVNNWLLLGSEDAPIAAFQRNTMIIEQLFEDTFMFNEQCIKPPYVLADWGDMIKANYDNGKFSLGYTLYRYTVNNYASENRRLLAIDGVQPNDQTIANQIYPLTANYYVVIPKILPEDHPARKLVAWLLSDDGQNLIQESGYVPLRESPSSQPPPLQIPVSDSVKISCGTGGLQSRANENSLFTLENLQYYNEDSGWYYGPFLKVDLPWNREFEKEINNWCEQTHAELEEVALNTEDIQANVRERAQCHGNLLNFHYSIGNGSGLIERTAVFDLLNNRRLTLSDLFMDSFNYIDYINTLILTDSFGRIEYIELDDFCGEEQYLYHPYSGLPSMYPYFTMTDELRLYFQGINPFFQVPDYAYDTSLSVPIWHDVSPWGACKVAITAISMDSERWEEKMIPSIHIDDGCVLEAEYRINTDLERMAALCENSIYGENWDHMPYLNKYQFKQYISLVYLWNELENVDFFDTPSTGGNIYNLHTGQLLFTPMEAMERASSNHYLAFQRFILENSESSYQMIDTYAISQDTVVDGMWIGCLATRNERGSLVTDNNGHVIYKDYFIIDLIEANGMYMRLVLLLEDMICN